MKPTEIFEHHDRVRDNETDLQGIVHHANYVIYFAHARHQHLKALGIDFKEMHDKGYDLVLYEANIKYRVSLTSGDEYLTTSKVIFPKPHRIAFEQQIVRKQDKKVAASAVMTAACVLRETGRPVIPDELKTKLGF